MTALAGLVTAVYLATEGASKALKDQIAANKAAGGIIINEDMFGTGPGARAAGSQTKGSATVGGRAAASGADALSEDEVGTEGGAVIAAGARAKAKGNFIETLNKLKGKEYATAKNVIMPFLSNLQNGDYNSGILQALLEYGASTNNPARTYDKIGGDMAARKVATNWTGMYFDYLKKLEAKLKIPDS